MSRRTLAYVGIAVLLLVGGRLLSTSSPGPAPSGSAAEPNAPASTAADAASSGVAEGPTLRRPPSSVAEYGIVTDRPDPALRALLDRDALAARIGPALCGDPTACDAVRAALRDEHATTLDVVAASDWNLARADLDAGARALTPAERARLGRAARVVVVHVATATDRRALALRTALAATSALAAAIDGVVWDQLLARFERARDFAAHAVTEPLGAPTFRRDRIEMLEEPKDDGVVRILTAGLSRWGEPDVEAAAVPVPVAPRVADVVLGVAQAIADGAEHGPVMLSLDDVARARGEAYPGDAGLPASAPIAVDVVPVHPEAGDPNDFLARIEPPAGEGPMAAMDLAERFFGALAAAPDPAAMDARRAGAQAQLAAALARWQAHRARGGALRVRLPFSIPGDAGVESMWVEVTGFDARTVTGRLDDDPLGATDVARGDVVTRPRAEVEDLDARGLAR